MPGTLQPLDEKFPIVGPDGRPTTYFIRWAQQKQIDISEGITAEQAITLIAEYIAEHPITVDWGDIGGTLADQTDLQAALDVKLTVIDDSAHQAPPRRPTYIIPADIDIGDPTIHGWFQLLRGVFSPNDTGEILFGSQNNNYGGFFGGPPTANNRIQIGSWGGPFEFDQTPYVLTDKFFTEGNLLFGDGLSYDSGTGVLEATGRPVLPVVDGSVPPNLVYLDDGSLVYAEIP